MSEITFSPDFRHAVYAGSFDPPTNGHLWVMEEGAKLFDELTVAVAVNPQKNSTFKTEERVEMLQDISRPFPNVRIGHFVNQYTVHYARHIGAQYLLRGLRDTNDYAAEQKLCIANRRIDPEIKTIMVSCPPELFDVSSSSVKGMVGPERWQEAVARYVPDIVLIALHQKELEKQATT